jgi:hypothetical protein
VCEPIAKGKGSVKVSSVRKGKCEKRNMVRDRKVEKETYFS